MSEVIVKMEGITKSFAGIKALNNVKLELNKGEVHALMGENGAGKSTLMKILTGVYQKDEGRILLKNDRGELAECEIKTPIMGQNFGMSMVFQEFNLLENMSIAENIFLGREPVNSLKSINKQKLYQDAQYWLKKVNLNLDPRVLVATLSCGQKQAVEIAKCLSFNAKVIILDEPTASLTDNEANILFDLISELKRKEVGIVYISHRMEEVFRLSDRITVFRDGTYIDTLEVAATNEVEIVKLMIGRELEEKLPRGNVAIDDEHVVLEVKNLKVFPKAVPFDFKLYKKEILGFFGLVGAGRTEMARIIFGIDPIGEGEIYIQGNKIGINSPKDAIASGVGLVPEDRKGLGLILGMSIKDNMLISKLAQLKSFILNKKMLKGISGSYIKELGIALANEEQEVKELSGGNQQKVVIAKWLAMTPDILILDEPTRGIDVGAKSEIYALMRRLTEQGKSIIMISSEMAEILKISDRVIIMREGKKTGELDIDQASQENIMQAAIGGIN